MCPRVSGIFKAKLSCLVDANTPPSAMTALLSGEMKDTVELNPAGAYALEKFFSKEERADLFRSWFGIAGMWMKGGDAVWGDENSAPDDPANTTDTYGAWVL